MGIVFVARLEQDAYVSAAILIDGTATPVSAHLSLDEWMSLCEIAGRIGHQDFACYTTKKWDVSQEAGGGR